MTRALSEYRPLLKQLITSILPGFLRSPDKSNQFVPGILQSYPENFIKIPS